MMQIGVSSYSYSRAARQAGWSDLEVIAKAAEMGFKCIEFAGLNPPEGESDLAFASKVREACNKHGLDIINYTVGADFLCGSDGDLDAEIARIQDEVRIAEALGAPGMRHDASRGFPEGHAGPKSFDAALDRLAQGCRAVTEFAEGRGIRTMVENHGYFCQDSERVEKLICAVNHPNFGALIDTGNFACADEDSAQAVARLAPYAFHVHVKDFHCKSGMMPFPGAGWFHTRAGNFLRGAIIGHGEIPVFQCLCLLHWAGYQGPLSIEFEGMEDPLEGIALGQAHLKELLIWLKSLTG